MDETVIQHDHDYADETQLPPGSILRERYRICRTLGQGGFGITYLAEDIHFRSLVAVKEFFPRSMVTRDLRYSPRIQCFTNSAEARFRSCKIRFLREAMALESLRDDPVVVNIRDYFEDNDTAYIVMEYVEGQDLKHHILTLGRPLTVSETFQILGPVFHALSRVHEAGLVHRDISPDNIMLSHFGGVKLVDFGAVRTVHDPDVDKGLSHSTEAILKHGFAPIEQYHSRGTLGPWTDEYALCATVWYCLTGAPPEPVATRMSEELHPDWKSIPGLLPHQRAALEKGMSLIAKDRFRSIGELYEALTQPPKKTLRKWILPALAIVLAVAVGAAALVTLLTKKTPEPTDPPTTGSAVITGGHGAAVDTTSSSDPSTEDPTTETVHAVSEPWRENVLMQSPLQLFDRTYKSIRSVYFLDTLEGKPDNAIDLSADGSGRVWGWYELKAGMTTVYIAADGGINAREACVALFKNYIKLETVDFGGAFHTEEAEDMSSMFEQCERLVSVDLSGFDTSNVRDMSSMFMRCFSLKTLDVNSFDTSMVTDMYGMFAVCTELTELDLSNFDTSSVTSMAYMFSGSKQLETVSAGHFDTSSVTTMEWMFDGCVALEPLELRNWDVSNVTVWTNFMPNGKMVNGRRWQELFQ